MLGSAARTLMPRGMRPQWQFAPVSLRTPGLGMRREGQDVGCSPRKASPVLSSSGSAPATQGWPLRVVQPVHGACQRPCPPAEPRAQEGDAGSAPADMRTARDHCNNTPKTIWEIEPAIENHTEFTLFNKILQTQINFPGPVFIVSSISREVTSVMID